MDGGEPFGIYDKLGTTPADPVVASADQTAVNIVFGDTPPQAQLTGSVSYTGSLGPVSSNRPVIVYLFQSPSGNNLHEVDRAIVGSSPQSFTLAAPAAGSYFLAY